MKASRAPATIAAPDGGYSGAPLAKKLGFAPPLDVWLLNPPPGYASWLGEPGPGVRLSPAPEAPIRAAHAFFVERRALAQWLPTLRRRLEPGGFAWVSWPKKSAKVPTDITEDVIRAEALPLGLVDVKVCAVSEVWSGLKLVIRRSERA